jgi:hypothetical protein
MGGRLNKNEKQRLGREEIEVSNRIKCLAIIMGSRGKWGMEGKLAFSSIFICLAKELIIDNITLKQLCISLMESRVKTGFEIWSLGDGWKEVREVYELFCKRVMGGVSTMSK